MYILMKLLYYKDKSKIRNQKLIAIYGNINKQFIDTYANTYLHIHYELI